jgi:co-chaperonin GroES (HSP10)
MVEGCREAGALEFSSTGAHVCAAHAREIDPHALRSLLKPLNDSCVILRDKPKANAGGLIIIPETAKDEHGRIKGAHEHATGFVLAVGPGFQQRKSLQGAFLNARKPVGARAGTRVVFRVKNEHMVVTEWRGLSIVHAFDVLAELGAEEAAAQ